MQDLKIVFIGTSEFVIPVLEALHQNFNVVSVVTSPDAPIGRKYIITPSPIAKKAHELNISVLKPENFDQSLINQLTNLNPDLFVVASYGHLIPKAILDIPKHGSLNIHPSKLPKYRGPSPIQSQILDRVKTSAVTIILMDEEMDHGPIIAQEEFKLSEQDTFEILHTKMFQAGAKLLIKIIPDFIEGELKPLAQNHAIATFCDKVTKKSGYFDINSPPEPEKLDRMIRAYYPWPTAWTIWNGKVVKFLPNTSFSNLIGESRNMSKALTDVIDSRWSLSRIQIRGGNDSPFLVQMEGKKAVPLKNFLNGYPDFPIRF
ncbi:methionyl-tRNA formyltransferase [Candidatus Daviesbacteria bacterium]|nr:methionyl-tRNA formyltransferase [Candidatus Daviesbacteria bacterium]